MRNSEENNANRAHLKGRVIRESTVSGYDIELRNGTEIKGVPSSYYLGVGDSVTIANTSGGYVIIGLGGTGA